MSLSAESVAESFNRICLDAFKEMHELENELLKAFQRMAKREKETKLALQYSLTFGGF